MSWLDELLIGYRRIKSVAGFAAQRFTVRFDGAGVQVADDSLNLETVVTITAANLGNFVPLDVSRSAAVTGNSTLAAPVNHKHDVAVDVPVDIGTANSQGNSTALAAANHVHRLTESMLRGILNTVTTAVTFNSQRLSSVADPLSAQDVATKNYVDGLANGVDWKASVRLATTANITLSGTQVIDGVTAASGNRVLVKDQTTQSANGIYVVAAGAWTRATDADTSAEVTGGLATWVSEGTTNGDTGWVLTTNDTITLGSTSLTFTQFTGLGQVVAGSGLTKTGNQLDVGAGTDISVAADSISVVSDTDAGANTIAKRDGAGSLAAFSYTGVTLGEVRLDAPAWVRRTAAGAERHREIPASAATTDATPATAATFAIPTGKMVTLRGTLTGYQTAGAAGAAGDAVAHVVQAAFRNVAGTVTQVGVTTEPMAAVRTGLTTAAASFAISGTSVNLRFTGEASKTIEVGGTLSVIGRMT